MPRRAPEMKNRNPQEVEEIKKALAQQREAEKVAQFENMNPQELMKQQRAAERKDEGLVSLDASDLELIPEAPKAETKKDKLTFAVAEAGSQGEVEAKTEYKGFNEDAQRERTIQDAQKVVAKFIEAGQDPEILRARYEADLESAQDGYEDAEGQDSVRKSFELKIALAKAQLEALDKLAGGQDGQEVVA